MESEQPESHQAEQIEDEQFSQTTDGAKRTEQDGLVEEGSVGGEFRLDADSEVAGANSPEDGEDYGDDRGEPSSQSDGDNGHHRGRRELFAKSEDDESYSQDEYEHDEEDEEEEYGDESGSPRSPQFEQTSQDGMGAAMRANNTSSGAMISQSYLTRSTAMKKSTMLEGMGGGLMQIGIIDLAAEEAIGKLKRQIAEKQRRQDICDGEEVAQSIRLFASEKVPINNERFDKFFRNNKFLKQFREQTDVLAVHELYKVFTLRQFSAGQTVFRYGTTSDESFFLLKGKIEKMVPQQTSFEAKTEEDLIKIYAENYENVIWGKVEDGEEMKKIVDLYLDDPNNLQLTKSNGSRSKFNAHQKFETLPVDVPLDMIEQEEILIQEQLSGQDSKIEGLRNGSSISNSEYKDFSEEESQHVKKTESRLEQQKSLTSTVEFNRGRKSNPVVTMQIGKKSDAHTEEAFIEDVWMFRSVDEVRIGQCFGQAALAQTKPHLVTYQCVEDCELISLNRESYTRVLEKAVKRDFQGRIQFLKSFRALSEMTQNQLETLLYNLKLMHFSRGQIIFRAGDKPDGVYLIQEGSFELQKPGKLFERQEKIVNAMKVDPMAKFKLRKQEKVTKDNSRKMVKLAILGTGELFGLEECQTKLNTQNKPKLRSYTVNCLQNNSKAIFLSHQILAEKVLNDPRAEQQIRYDCALKEFFHNSRELQHQQTVWNGALTNMRQIENAADKADDDFDKALKRDYQKKLNPEMKGMPKLHTIDHFMKQKFETTILNTIMDRMQVRATNNLMNMDDNVQILVKKRMTEIQTHFASHINVIDADRKEQKARKAHLDVIKKLEKSRSMIAAASQSIGQGSLEPVTQGDSQTLLQDSLLSQSPYQGTSINEYNFDVNLMQHHQLVKPRSLDQMQYEEQLTESEHAVHHTVRKQKQVKLAIDPIELNMSHTPKESLKGDLSRFGLTSNAAETVNALAAAVNQDVRSQNIEEGDTGTGNGTTTPRDGILPPVSGDRSDGAVFRGLNNSAEGSGAAIVSQSQLEKVIEVQKQNEQDLEGKLGSQTAPEMNKTQGQFHNKERENLMDRFKDQTNEADQAKAEQPQKPFETPQPQSSGEPIEYQTGASQGTPIPAAEDTSKRAESQAKDGGIIVSHRSRQDLKNTSQMEKRDSKPRVDVQMHELSDTTGGSPTHKGLSILRDPRYSQDIAIRKQPSFGIGKNRLGMADNIAGGLDSPIKIPKIALQTDAPVYKEGEEHENKNSAIERPDGMSPTVNISMRLASKNQIKEPLTATPGSKYGVLSLSPTSGVKVYEQLKAGQLSATEEKPSIYRATGPLVSSELPYAQHVNQSGLKGKKRNQMNYVSKTIAEKSLKSKLRALVNRTTDLTPQPNYYQQEQTQHTLNNSFTVNMPELYTEAVYSQSFDSGRNYAAPGGFNVNGGMFPILSPKAGNVRNEASFVNADINMLDTAQLGNVHDVQRIVDSHQQSHLKKEVFVPSQINPRMKRNVGRSLATERKHTNRGASSLSINTLQGGKSRKNERMRAYSIGQRQQMQMNGSMSQKISMDGYQVANAAKLLFSPHNGRQPSFDETGNSYAKQMQNMDDSQYQAAIMREARQQQMVLEAARAAQLQSQQVNHNDGGEFDQSFSEQLSPFNLSAQASAAASELIQKFLKSPNEPISTDHFLNVQRKYELPPFEAYQLLLQQIQFQKALLTPPTAATVIKVSHNTYNSAVRDKREEVISFRNDLYRRYTYNSRRRPSNDMARSHKSKVSAGMQAASETHSPVSRIKTTRKSKKSNI